MNLLDPSPAWQSRVLSVLRIAAAFMFLLHGTQKLFVFPAGPDPRPAVELMSLIGLAGVLETFGGLLLLLGAGTRVVAFILSGQMAVAYFKSHFPQSFWPVLNRGELAALYAFLFLYFSVAGGGVWSVDRWLTRRRRSTGSLGD
jgi:putative oxidoreductase